jgi:hypothetical protein
MSHDFLDSIQEEAGCAYLGSGGHLPLNPSGWAAVVSRGSLADIEAFISYAVQSMGARVVDGRKLTQCAIAWSDLTKAQHNDAHRIELIYSEMLAGICHDARASRSWVSAGDAVTQAPPELTQAKVAEAEALEIARWMRYDASLEFG